MDGWCAVGESVEEWAGTLPAAPLRPFVDGYCGYRQRGLAPARHRGLPSPTLTMIITLDDPLEVAEHPDPQQAGDRYETLVGGLHTRPALITHQGAQSGVQLSVSPLGARALFGMPAGELAATDVHGHDVLGRFATQVQDRLRTATSWAERFALLDDLLCARLTGTPTPTVATAVRPDVAHAWRRIVGSGGRVAVQALAREVACSPRHLGTLFDREIGLSPKEAARVVRFDRARRRLQGAGPGALAQLAA
jgi:AraC-like DNA-binding protein